MPSNFFAIISRMKLINRWGLKRNTRQENLSEHSLETAIIAHALCVINNKRLNGNLNPERAAVLAMFHDASEIITGDLPTPIKYYNSNIKEAYKHVEILAAQALCSKLPDDLKATYDSILNISGDDAKYDTILKAADKISALIKCVEERKSGNTEFVNAEYSTFKAINDLKLKEVEIFMAEFFPAYHLTIDDLT